MTARVLDGRSIAREIVDESRRIVTTLGNRGSAPPTIAVVRVGNDAASLRYGEQIRRVFTAAGLGFRLVSLPEATDEAGLASSLTALNADPTVNGILLLFPIPSHLSQVGAAERIDPRKDVDGVHPLNAGRLFLHRGRFFAPATPAGGIEVLIRSGIEIAGRRAVVVGRSAIVGRPLAMLLLARHATVTLCHSRTVDLDRFTRSADILAVAVGRPEFITGDMIAPGAAVLDFGINVVDGKVVGDVDFLAASASAGAITPVPGGTGPVTNAMLLRHTIQAAVWQAGAEDVLV